MHPLVQRIADLFLRPGYLPRRMSDAVNRARIAGEWQLGQWVLMAGPDEALWGWMSWYRVSAEVLALIKAADAEALLARGDPRELTRGEYCYIATAVVAPWAPRGTYRRLYQAVRAANPDARRICGHFIKRDGRVIYHERGLEEAA